MPKNPAFIANNNSNASNCPNINKFAPDDPFFANFVKTNNPSPISKNTKKYADREPKYALFAWETFLYGNFQPTKAGAKDVEKKE